LAHNARLSSVDWYIAADVSKVRIHVPALDPEDKDSTLSRVRTERHVVTL